jgi:D-serine deaminase-like pyridoxal phosphate-dependent protein
MKLSEVPTPALLIDPLRVERNCRRMREKALGAGVVFRPHVKTHKCIEAGRLQHGGEQGPITVSTLAEAEFFAAAGFTDITYAFPIAPSRLDRVRKIIAGGTTMNLLVDHLDAVSALEGAAASDGGTFDAFMKIDCGYHRAGVSPESEESMEIARRMIESPSIRLRGFLTHAGHSYHASSPGEIVQIAAEEVRAVSVMAERVRELSTEPMIRSVGSTPTCMLVESFESDEVRPGNYVFFDAYQMSLGSCRIDDCAATVLTTVVGVYPGQRKVIVDAGTLAVAREPAAKEESGWGIVCDLDLEPLALALRSMSQEHGQIFETSPGGIDRLKVGDQLRIIPNHSCITAALHERYHLLEDGSITGEWRPVRGW